MIREPSFGVTRMFSGGPMVAEIELQMRSINLCRYMCVQTRVHTVQCREASVVSDSLRPHGLQDCSPPGSLVHGILQARLLQWVAISSSRGSSQPGNEPVSLVSPVLAGGFFTRGLSAICYANNMFYMPVLSGFQRAGRLTKGQIFMKRGKRFC